MMPMTKVKANYRFREAHSTKCRYVVLWGSAGSGKSVDTAHFLIRRIASEKGRNLLVVRKAEATHRDSTFAELTKAIEDMGLQDAFDYPSGETSKLYINCKNGNSILFRGAYNEKERDKLKSITAPSGDITDVWIEEATDLTQEDFEIIDDRLRGTLPDGLFYQIRLTFNPVSATHWIKEQFFDMEDPDVLTLHSTYLDNAFIDEAYHRRMMRRKERDPDGYRIYGLGEWGETGGLILPNYKAKTFNIDESNFESMRNSQDFGFNAANVLLELGFKDGDIYVCREMYKHEMDTNELITLANERRFRKNLLMWCDSAEPDRIKMWRDGGYKARGVKKEPGSVLAQIDYLKQSMIYIHPSCVNTIAEIKQWKWVKDPVTGKYTDEPVNYFDDAMAALRYGIEDRRRAKPREAKIRSKADIPGLW